MFGVKFKAVAFAIVAAAMVMPEMASTASALPLAPIGQINPGASAENSSLLVYVANRRERRRHARRHNGDLYPYRNYGYNRYCGRYYGNRYPYRRYGYNGYRGRHYDQGYYRRNRGYGYGYPWIGYGVPFIGFGFGVCYASTAMAMTTMATATTAVAAMCGGVSIAIAAIIRAVTPTSVTTATDTFATVRTNAGGCAIGRPLSVGENTTSTSASNWAKRRNGMRRLKLVALTLMAEFLRWGRLARSHSRHHLLC